MSPFLFMNYPLAYYKFHWFVNSIQSVNSKIIGHFLNIVNEQR